MTTKRDATNAEIDHFYGRYIDLFNEGQAQQDKAEAQRNAAKKEAQAEKARAEAKVHEARERAEQH